MDSTERVRNTILGKPTDRQPIYGWVAANLSNELTQAYGSVQAFEDKYEFDAAHLFGGPGCFREEVFNRLRAENDEMTPDLLLDENIYLDPDFVLQVIKTVSFRPFTLKLSESGNFGDIILCGGN